MAGPDTEETPLTMEQAKAVGFISDPTTQSSVGDGVLAGSAAAIPLAARATMEAATNPGVRRALVGLGQVAGGIEGAIKGGPLGAAGGAWAGGRAGYYTGALAQKMAAPVAAMAEKAAPYAQALSTLSGMQGLLDMAQISDPTRKDIGVGGVTIGDKRAPGDDHPAALNALADAFSQSLAKAPETWHAILNTIKQRLESK